MIAIVLVTHGTLGESILNTAKCIGCCEADGVHIFSVECESDVEQLKWELAELFNNSPEGVLVLADLFGGSGSNIPVLAARDMDHVMILSGVNLSMFISAMQGRDKMTVRELAAKVEADGKRAVINVSDFMG